MDMQQMLELLLANQIKGNRSGPDEERELLGTNSLTEGAVWHICPMQGLLNHRNLETPHAAIEL
jgi:hypothetical protein